MTQVILLPEKIGHTEVSFNEDNNLKQYVMIIFHLSV